MEARNRTQVAKFLFLGSLGVPHGQMYLFVVFLAIFLVTVIGNATIFTLIQLDSRLHSPMYFFLSHLSCLDVCYLSVTVPKILINFSHQRNTISYSQCMAQMFFLITFTGSECVLLAVMAFDRYTAICQPLHYNTLMSSQVRVPLAAASWIWGLLNSSLHTALATNLDLCGANHIDHIFCDVPLLLKITCSDTYVKELTLHLATIFTGLSPFLFILFSYAYIVSAILKIRSDAGRSKAFSTCAAHLIVLMIYFGMANVNYNRPSPGCSLGVDTLISTLYCILTPLLNPLIYSLRNKAVKGALQQLLSGLKPDYTFAPSK